MMIVLPLFFQYKIVNHSYFKFSRKKLSSLSEAIPYRLLFSHYVFRKNTLQSLSSASSDLHEMDICCCNAHRKHSHLRSQTNSYNAPPPSHPHSLPDHNICLLSLYQFPWGRVYSGCSTHIFLKLYQMPSGGKNQSQNNPSLFHQHQKSPVFFPHSPVCSSPAAL